MHPLTLRQLAAEHIQALIAEGCQERRVHQARGAQRHGQPARLRRSVRPDAQQHESRLPTAAIVANPGHSCRRPAGA